MRQGKAQAAGNGDSLYKGCNAARGDGWAFQKGGLLFREHLG